jgi:hypothetical protein
MRVELFSLQHVFNGLRSDRDTFRADIGVFCGDTRLGGRNFSCCFGELFLRISQKEILAKPLDAKS